MAHISFAPVIYKQYWRKAGYYSIRMRITVGRKQKFITTNEVAYPHQLTRTLKIRDMDLQNRLLKLERRMRDALSDVDMFDLELMSLDDIAKHIELRINGGFRLDFLAFWPQAVADKPEGSRSNYTVALNSFKKYLGKDSLDISKVTARLMRDYEAWLVAKHGKGARAVSMYTAAVKHIHSLARKKYNDDEFGDVAIRNPFEFYSPPKSRPAKHRNVEAAVIQTMIDTRHQLTGIERRAVDTFLLSFALMGMNSPDLLSCAAPKNDIIIYNRQKTRDRRADRAEMHVKIDERIRPLFDEWREAKGRYAFKFHRIHANYRQFNGALAYGIRKYRQRMNIEKLDFYSARHTWASLAYSIGIDKHTINDCLCHTDEAMKVTDIYINKDWSVLWKANEKVLDLFKWS